MPAQRIEMKTGFEQAGTVLGVFIQFMTHPTWTVRHGVILIIVDDLHDVFKRHLTASILDGAVNGYGPERVVTQGIEWLIPAILHIRVGMVSGFFQFLGFLAGLWLAPLIENNLPGIFSLLLTMPIAVLLAAWFWRIYK